MFWPASKHQPRLCGTVHSRPLQPWMVFAVATLFVVVVFWQPMRAELLSQPQGLDVGGDHYGSKPKLPFFFLSTGW
jgi:hypothetical protein